MKLGRLHDDSDVAVDRLGHLSSLLHQWQKGGRQQEMRKVIDSPAGEAEERYVSGAFSERWTVGILTDWQDRPS